MPDKQSLILKLVRVALNELEVGNIEIAKMVLQEALLYEEE